MSPPGPSRPIAALQFFGRYWGHSGHRDALEPEGSVAIDAVDGAHSTASIDLPLSFSSTRS